MTRLWLRYLGQRSLRTAPVAGADDRLIPASVSTRADDDRPYPLQSRPSRQASFESDSTARRRPVVGEGGPVVNRHRSSVDVLFPSAAKCAVANVLSIIMTGPAKWLLLMTPQRRLP